MDEEPGDVAPRLRVALLLVPTDVDDNRDQAPQPPSDLSLLSTIQSPSIFLFILSINKVDRSFFLSFQIFIPPSIRFLFRPQFHSSFRPSVCPRLHS